MRGIDFYFDHSKLICVSFGSFSQLCVVFSPDHIFQWNASHFFEKGSDYAARDGQATVQNVRNCRRNWKKVKIEFLSRLL